MGLLTKLIPDSWYDKGGIFDFSPIRKINYEEVPEGAAPFQYDSSKSKAWNFIGHINNPYLNDKADISPIRTGAEAMRFHMGEDLSEIINQDGDEKSDSQIVDEIVDYLKELKIYKERK